jgi:hypothetical protein
MVVVILSADFPFPSSFFFFTQDLLAAPHIFSLWAIAKALSN